VVQKQPQKVYTVEGEDILALMKTLQGKDFAQDDIDRVKKAFPGLMEEEKKTVVTGA
jgi:hypothetical protein